MVTKRVGASHDDTAQMKVCGYLVAVLSCLYNYGIFYDLLSQCNMYVWHLYSGGKFTSTPTEEQSINQTSCCMYQSTDIDQNNIVFWSSVVFTHMPTGTWCFIQDFHRKVVPSFFCFSFLRISFDSLSSADMLIMRIYLFIYFYIFFFWGQEHRGDWICFSYNYNTC